MPVGSAFRGYAEDAAQRRTQDRRKHDVKRLVRTEEEGRPAGEPSQASREPN